MVPADPRNAHPLCWSGSKLAAWAAFWACLLADRLALDAPGDVRLDAGAGFHLGLGAARRWVDALPPQSAPLVGDIRLFRHSSNAAVHRHHINKSGGSRPICLLFLICLAS